MGDNMYMPSGEETLHPDWPEGRFVVSGLFGRERLISTYLSIVEEWFHCRAPIESVYGAPPMCWNGGRFFWRRTPFDMGGFASFLEGLYARGIGCRLTFTNHLLGTHELDDRFGNMLLDCIAQRADLNAVIVTSDLLSRYIARRHPDLRQIASHVKVVLEGGKGNLSYYRDLEQRYFRYVVHRDDCYDLKVLDALSRDKVEILLNERCDPYCPLVGEHYTATARANMATRESAPPDEAQRAEKELVRVEKMCPNRNRRPSSGPQGRTTPPCPSRGPCHLRAWIPAVQAPGAVDVFQHVRLRFGPLPLGAGGGCRLICIFG